MKKTGMILLALFLLSGCIMTPGGLEDITGSLTITSLEPGPNDVKHDGILYKGVYSNLLKYGSRGCDYNVLRSPKVPIRNLIEMNEGEKYYLTTGIYKAFKYESVLVKGDLFSPDTYRQRLVTATHLPTALRVSLTVYKGDKKLLTTRQVYRYRDYTATRKKDILCLPVVMREGDIKLTGKGAIYLSPGNKYGIEVEYHSSDPSRNTGTFVKGWSYRLNWDQKQVEEKKESPPMNISAVHWEKDMKQANAKAKAQGKPMVLFMTTRTEGCPPCGKQLITFMEASVAERLNRDFIPVILNINDKNRAKLMNRFKVRALPTTFFFASDGSAIGRRPGMFNVKQAHEILDKVQAHLIK